MYCKEIKGLETLFNLQCITLPHYEQENEFNQQVQEMLATIKNNNIDLFQQKNPI